MTITNDLNPLIKWASDWLMEFNIPKGSMCSYVTITLRRNKSSFNTYLGICLHHRLSCDPHSNYICSKANLRLAGICTLNQ